MATPNRRPAPLTLRHYSAPQSRELRDLVSEIYQDAYTDAIASGDPFDSVEAFMERFDAYTRRDNGFELVIGYTDDGDSVGQTWGWPLTPRSAWWTNLETEPEPGFTDEDGNRTFALSEIMVRRSWTGRGIAHALHDELLRGRTEKRATLLVEPDNHSAYRAYLSWGWKHVGHLRPGWPDAPRYDVLILPLPLA